MRTVIAEAIDQSVRVVFHCVAPNDFRTVIRAAARLTAEGFECSAAERDVRFRMWEC